jgi:hypothetical protein
MHGPQNIKFTNKLYTVFWTPTYNELHRLFSAPFLDNDVKSKVIFLPNSIW